MGRDKQGEDETTDLEVIANRLVDRWVRGFLTDTLDELGEMPSYKAAFICGMMVAMMHGYDDDGASIRMTRFLDHVKERYYS